MKYYVILLLFCLSLRSYSQSRCPILPAPVTYTFAHDSISLASLLFCTNNIPDSISSAISSLGELYLAEEQQFIALVRDTGFIRFSRLTNAFPESYSINITKSAIQIAYTSTTSCYHALHSLYQLIGKKSNQRFSIPVCFVKDYPKFSWRGLHLDVSRHFFTVPEIKKYLDLMAMYKFNVFHWHLTDDQGWRIEIKKYPKLTEIGAWRDSTVNNHYSTYPRTWNIKRYGGFYTHEEIKEVVQYATNRHITIVPEIEMPGHARAALAAYPAFSCTGLKQPVPGLWGVFDDVFCTKDSTLQFLQDILDEVLMLFPGKFIHVGGDEVPKTRWKACPACQDNLKKHSLKNEHELQSYFIRQMDLYLTKHHRQLMGWDEILEGGLSPGAAVMSWRGTDGGIAAAKDGHFVVMSPGSHCYFDHYQSKSTSEPLAIGGYTSLEKVYDFQPIPKELSTQEAQFVLGGQANLWTEYIPSFDQLTYMAYPRAIALSQVLWGGSKAPYKTFEEVLKTHHIPRLIGPNLNTHVALSFMKPNVKFHRIPNGISLGFEFKDSSECVVVHSSGVQDGVRLEGNKTLNFKRPETQTTKNQLTIDSPCCADSLTLICHQGLGANVSYETPPNQRYNSGDLTLVDGQFGARPWRGNQWVGFDTNEVKIRIDLGKKTKIQGLELGFLNEPSSWIHLPTQVTLLTDKKTRKPFQIIAERTSIKCKDKTQYIVLLLKGPKTIPPGLPGEGNTPWIFADEFIIK